MTNITQAVEQMEIMVPMINQFSTAPRLDAPPEATRTINPNILRIQCVKNGHN